MAKFKINIGGIIGGIIGLIVGFIFLLNQCGTSIAGRPNFCQPTFPGQWIVLFIFIIAFLIIGWGIQKFVFKK